MDLAPVIARIRSQVTALKFVGGAADLAAAAEDLKIAPAAYVYALAERAARSGGIGYVAQQVTARFGVVIAARNLRDARGEAAAADLEPLRTSVRAALVGWAPAAGYDRCEYVGGRLLQLAQAVLWWQDDFETTYAIKG